MNDAASILFGLAATLFLGGLFGVILDTEHRLDRIERRLGIVEEDESATRGADSVSTKTGAKMC